MEDQETREQINPEAYGSLEEVDRYKIKDNYKHLYKYKDSIYHKINDVWNRLYYGADHYVPTDLTDEMFEKVEEDNKVNVSLCHPSVLKQMQGARLIGTNVDVLFVYGAKVNKLIAEICERALNKPMKVTCDSGRIQEKENIQLYRYDESNAIYMDNWSEITDVQLKLCEGILNVNPELAKKFLNGELVDNSELLNITKKFMGVLEGEPSKPIEESEAQRLTRKIKEEKRNPSKKERVTLTDTGETTNMPLDGQAFDPNEVRGFIDASDIKQHKDVWESENIFTKEQMIEKVNEWIDKIDTVNLMIRLTNRNSTSSVSDVIKGVFKEIINKK